MVLLEVVRCIGSGLGLECGVVYRLLLYFLVV